MTVRVCRGRVVQDLIVLIFFRKVLIKLAKMGCKDKERSVAKNRLVRSYEKDYLFGWTGIQSYPIHYVLHPLQYGKNIHKHYSVSCASKLH